MEGPASPSLAMPTPRALYERPRVRPGSASASWSGAIATPGASLADRCRRAPPDLGEQRLQPWRFPRQLKTEPVRQQAFGERDPARSTQQRGARTGGQVGRCESHRKHSAQQNSLEPRSEDVTGQGGYKLFV